MNVVSSKTLALDLYQELRYSLLLSTCRDELISAPKIVTFSPNSPFGIDNVPRISNEIPCP